MEFERIKLINEYKADPPKHSDGDEAAPPKSPGPAEGETPVFVDYMYVCLHYNTKGL